jgi:CrcB protein
VARGWWDHPWLLVALGGALGSVLRYALGRWAGGQPVATLAINVAGSFALALVVRLFQETAGAENPALVQLLGSGFCGGFTTFSTFEVETFRLLREGRALAAFAYVTVSVIAGFAAVAIVMNWKQ